MDTTRSGNIVGLVLFSFVTVESIHIPTLTHILSSDCLPYKADSKSYNLLSTRKMAKILYVLLGFSQTSFRVVHRVKASLTDDVQDFLDTVHEDHRLGCGKANLEAYHVTIGLTEEGD